VRLNLNEALKHHIRPGVVLARPHDILSKKAQEQEHQSPEQYVLDSLRTEPFSVNKRRIPGGHTKRIQIHISAAETGERFHAAVHRAYRFLAKNFRVEFYVYKSRHFKGKDFLWEQRLFEDHVHLLPEVILKAMPEHSGIIGDPKMAENRISWVMELSEPKAGKGLWEGVPSTEWQLMDRPNEEFEQPARQRTSDRHDNVEIEKEDGKVLQRSVELTVAERAVKGVKSRAAKGARRELAENAVGKPDSARMKIVDLDKGGREMIAWLKAKAARTPRPAEDPAQDFVLDDLDSDDLDSDRLDKIDLEKGNEIIASRLESRAVERGAKRTEEEALVAKKAARRAAKNAARQAVTEALEELATGTAGKANSDGQENIDLVEGGPVIVSQRTLEATDRVPQGPPPSLDSLHEGRKLEAEQDGGPRIRRLITRGADAYLSQAKYITDARERAERNFQERPVRIWKYDSYTSPEYERLPPLDPKGAARYVHWPPPGPYEQPRSTGPSRRTRTR
jgi:hypothetical protein